MMIRKNKWDVTLSKILPSNGLPRSGFEWQPAWKMWDAGWQLAGALYLSLSGWGERGRERDKRKRYFYLRVSRVTGTSKNYSFQWGLLILLYVLNDSNSWMYTFWYNTNTDMNLTIKKKLTLKMKVDAQSSIWSSYSNTQYCIVSTF